MGRREPTEEIEHIQETKVYVIYEGRKTEPNYFQYFSEEHSSGYFTIIPVPKDYFDTNNTDREDLVSIMRGYLTEQNSGQLTSFWFATKLMKKVVDWIPCDPNNMDDELKEIFTDAREQSVRAANMWGATDDKDIVINSGLMMDIVSESIEDILNEYDIDPNDLDPDLIHSEIMGDFGNTLVFIVFDRDYCSSRTDDDYRKIFEQCKQYGYDILLSTPHFEFWLLMHHDNVDLSRFGYRNKEDADKVVKELVMREGYIGDPERYKGINRKRFNTYYRDKFNQAVENSKLGFLSLTLDIGENGRLGLINNIGSNVGIQLSRLIGK